MTLPVAGFRLPATGNRQPGTILILGGAGMVGLQVAREAVRELKPQRIVISALTQREVDEALAILRRETSDVEFAGAAGDIFLPQSLQGIDRSELIANRKHFDELFSDDSSLFQLIQEHQPDVIVDCINTATAIAYLDVFTVTERTRMLLEAVESSSAPLAVAELQPLIRSVRELMIAQGVPQIVRHILVLHRALENSSVRVYVKVGTTGTGGMGINIPYTHSEDKPSPQLLSKSDRPRRQRPFLSKMVRSGVNGLVALNDPPTAGVSLLLQLLPAGSPLPDSTTSTWKSFLLPTKAIPVGKLRSLAKTETLKPAGTAMSWPLPGS